MSDVILFAILGIGAGATYACLGVGLVLIQKASGTVNFAHGAIAGFGALWFTSMVDGGLPKAVALIVALLGAAVFGALFHLVVMRPLRSAPALTRIVTTLGLLIALQGAAIKIWGAPTFSATPIFPRGSVELFGIAFGVDRIWLLGFTLLLATCLWAVYRFTGFGIATRAISENERAAALLGSSPTAIGMANWAIGCALAVLAGIFIAPIASLDIQLLSLLVLPALAAALVGRFSSFAVTCAVALGIGVAQSLITRYWTQPGAAAALPFVVVVVAMAFAGQLIPARGQISAGRPPLAPARRIRPQSALLLAALCVVGLAVLNGEYQAAIATSAITAGLALSLVVVTGFVGQISLAQMTFAGAASLLLSKLSVGAGIPFPWPILIASLIVVPIGVLLGLPALRVRGINLAIVTLGAAVAVSAFVFGNLDWTGGVGGSRVASPTLFGFSLDASDHPFRFGVMTLVVVALLALAVGNLRRSPSGRRMLAVRSNERAASIVGVSVEATKLQAFAFSSFVAGVAGGLFAYQLGAISFERFDPMASIMLIALACIGGIATVSGGMVAGLIASGGVVYVLLSHVGGLDSWWSILAGVGLLVTALTQPDGAAIATQQQIAWVAARLRRGRRGATPEPGEPASQAAR